MRIKEPFAEERISGSLMYKPKVFIASEGSTTEPIYFEKLNQSIISENVSIINILRDYAQAGYSNPTHIVKLFSEFLDNSNEEEITVSFLKNKIKNWNHENPNKIDICDVFHQLDNRYMNDNCKIKYNELDNLFIQLFRSDIYEDLAKNFMKYFQVQDVTYSDITDSLNMAIDRDKESFTDKQYDKVVSYCKENSINLFVSNPCFEFWLFLHFKEVENEDEKKLFLNEKISSSRRYIEKRLNDICKYRKNFIPFESFEPNIRDAIKRAKGFATNLEDIKNNLGTNVGDLVESIIENNL